MDQRDNPLILTNRHGEPYKILGHQSMKVLDQTKQLINTFQNLGFGGMGFPGANGYPGTPTISTINTLDRNLRWYLVSNFRQTLSEGYVELGLIQTIVDVPVDDAFRGGVELKSKQLDEDQILDLTLSLKRDKVITSIKQANKWRRLFGGAAILIIVADQDPKTPLDIDSINENSDIEYRPIDLWELFWDIQEANTYDPSTSLETVEFYSYYGIKVHKSRVIKLKGKEAPSFIRPRLRGWGLSVVEILVRSINQYLKATDLGFEVLDEFKLDVFKLKGMAAMLMQPDGQAAVQARVQLANARKNYQNATVLDADDEFTQRQLSFSGLGETMQGIRIQVAADLRMPLTKIFGISASGFNSGEDDIEVYNGMVESTVRDDDSESAILRMAEIQCKKMFNLVPDDLQTNFKPLRVLGATDEQTVKTGKAAILDSARSRGDITTLEYRESVNAGKLMDTQLDTSDKMMAELEEGQQDLLAEEPAPGEEETQEETEPGKKGGSGGGQGPKAPKTPKAGAAKEAPAAKKPKEPSSPKANALVRLFSKMLNAVGDKPEIVAVGIVSQDGRQILTGKRRDNGLWTSPGGHMDLYEAPEEAAVREVLEETGLEISPENLQLISSQTLTSHRTGRDFILHAYLAKIDRQDASPAADPDHEVVEWKWVPIAKDTPELLQENRHAKDDEVLEYLFNLEGYTDPEREDFENQTWFNMGPLFSTQEIQEAISKYSNGPLWEKAKKKSQDEYGQIKWPFVMFLYKKYEKSNASWEESKHPRDEGGKFSTGGGGSSPAGKKKVPVSR